MMEDWGFQPTIPNLYLLAIIMIVVCISSLYYRSFPIRASPSSACHLRRHRSPVGEARVRSATKQGKKKKGKGKGKGKGKLSLYELSHVSHFGVTRICTYCTYILSSTAHDYAYIQISHVGWDRVRPDQMRPDRRCRLIRIYVYVLVQYIGRYCRQVIASIDPSRPKKKKKKEKKGKKGVIYNRSV